MSNSISVACPSGNADSSAAAQHILLVCKEPHSTTSQLSALLAQAGYLVDFATGFADCVDRLFSRVVHLVLVVNTEECDEAWQTVRDIRTTASVPIMVVSTNPSESSGVQAFEAGADDFATRATSPAELLLRIAAVLRRRKSSLDETDEPTLHELRRAQFYLNKERKFAQFREAPLDLTLTQFRLLWILLYNARSTVHRELLYKLVLEKDSALYDRSLDMHVCRLRKKLESAGMDGSRIKTVRGSGYRFD